MASGIDNFVVLGVITGAHGIRGEVKLKSFTAEPEAIASYGPLDTSAGTRLVIKTLRAVKNGFVARIDGIADRNQAEAARGLELRLPRTDLPDPVDDEFYHADLIGLRAETTAGEAWGEVTAVHDFGAGDLLEIRLEDGGRTELIAFTAETVPEIDIKAGRIVVVPAIEANEDSEKT